jgi:hypothetical protein
MPAPPSSKSTPPRPLVVTLVAPAIFLSPVARAAFIGDNGKIAFGGGGGGAGTGGHCIADPDDTRIGC